MNKWKLLKKRNGDSSRNANGQNREDAWMHYDWTDSGWVNGSENWMDSGWNNSSDHWTDSGWANGSDNWVDGGWANGSENWVNDGWANGSSYWSLSSSWSDSGYSSWDNGSWSNGSSSGNRGKNTHKDRIKFPIKTLILCILGWIASDGAITSGLVIWFGIFLILLIRYLNQDK